MIKDKFFRLLTALAFIGTFNSSIYTSPAWSQRTLGKVTLFSGTKCISSGSSILSKLRIRNSPENISISRQSYISSEHLVTYRDNSTLLTCKVDSRKFSTLKLKMGVSDNDKQYNAVMTVNVYQGGNKQHTYNNIEAGQLIETILDVQNRNIVNSEDVAIELLCHKGRRCNLYFLETQLLPGSNFISPKSSKSSQK